MIAKYFSGTVGFGKTPQATSKLKESLLTVVDVYNCISLAALMFLITRRSPLTPTDRDQMTRHVTEKMH